MSRTRHHGDKAKQRAFGRNWQWLAATPAWWTRLMMTRPQRRLAAVWQCNAQKSRDFEALDSPPHGRKPHVYYW